MSSYHPILPAVYSGIHKHSTLPIPFYSHKNTVTQLQFNLLASSLYHFAFIKYSSSFDMREPQELQLCMEGKFNIHIQHIIRDTPLSVMRIEISITQCNKLITIYVWFCADMNLRSSSLIRLFMF